MQYEALRRDSGSAVLFPHSLAILILICIKRVLVPPFIFIPSSSGGCVSGRQTSHEKGNSRQQLRRAVFTARAVETGTRWTQGKDPSGSLRNPERMGKSGNEMAAPERDRRSGQPTAGGGRIETILHPHQSRIVGEKLQTAGCTQ